MFKRIMTIAGAGFAALAGTVLLAWAQGGFFAPNMPIIGGASYCSSTVNAACVNTVPAGPAVTGLEYVPADTSLSGGTNPQSGKFSLMSLGGGVNTYIDGTANATVTAQTRRIIVAASGTVSALTITFPASTTGLVDGQRFGLCTTQIVSSLTVTAGAGTTVNQGPTALLVPTTVGVASCVDWIYRLSNTTWYRTQ